MFGRWWKYSDDEYDDEPEVPNWRDYGSWKKPAALKKKKTGVAPKNAKRPTQNKGIMSQVASLISTTAAAVARFVSGDSDNDDGNDTEILFGSLRGEVVGLRYYKGVVNNNEMVSLVREPQNAYDPNAVKVTNVIGDQVGHIKKELACPLTFIIDRKLARVEGTVPFGAQNKFTMPVDLMFWGQPEKKEETVAKLKQYGYFMSDGREGGSFGLSQPQRTKLSNAQIKSELDKLFENLDEGDKATEANPCEAISTPLFPHQCQALGWMMRVENDQTLPPFWEEKPGPLYYNSITVSTTKTRPKPIHGGILADDMGLGKTLTVIALVLTNFDNKQPLVSPVSGYVRASKKAKLKRLEAYRHSAGSQFYSGCMEMSSKSDDLAASQGKGVRKRLVIKKSKSEASATSAASAPEIQSSASSNMLDNKELTLKSQNADIARNRKLNDQEWDPAPMKKRGKKVILEKAATMEITTSGRPKRVTCKPIKYQEVNNGDEENEPEVKNKTGTVKLIATKQAKEVSVIPESSLKSMKANDLLESALSQEDSMDIMITEDADTDKQKSDENFSNSNTYAKDSKLKINESQRSGVNLEDLQINSQPVIVIDDDLPDLGEEVCVVSTAVVDHQYAAADKAETSNVMSKPSTSQQSNVTSKPSTSQQSDFLNTETKMVEELSANQEEEFDLPDLGLLNIPEPCAVAKFGKSTGRFKGKGPRVTLIVCPLSTLGNWLDQFEEHVDERVMLQIYTYYGSSRTSDVKLLSDQDVVLTTYQTLSLDIKNEGPLQKIHWLRVVLDEGHTIRNPAAQMTKMIMLLKTERKWIVTGTPIQNSLKDLWSLIRFIGIEPFNDSSWWRRIIERPLSSDNNGAALKRIQALLNSIAMRRVKTQERNGKPLVSLPKKEIYLEKIQLSEEERGMYDAMQKEGRILVSKYFQEGTLLHHYGDVLAIMMRLRQMCCHPLLFARAAKAAQQILAETANTENIEKDEFRAALIAKIMLVLSSGSDEECAICLEQLKSPVITHCAHLYCRPCIEAVITAETRDNGRAKCPLCRGDVTVDQLVEAKPEETSEGQEVSVQSWQSSTKVDAVMTALTRLRAENPEIKSLVVSQFTSFLRMLEIPLKQNGFHFVHLDGSMSNKQRASAIEIFSDSTRGSPTIMLLSLKAGGVGLNLIAASRVFLLDPAWNPASEEQCFDRCHRIGQTREVIVTKFLVENSVEERMLELQERKRKLVQGIFGGVGRKQTAEEKRQNLIADIKTLIDL